MMSGRHVTMAPVKHPVRTRAFSWRIGPALTVSAIVHGALVGAVLSGASGESRSPDVVMVDLVDAGPSIAAEGAPVHGLIEPGGTGPRALEADTEAPPVMDDRVAALVAERDELARRLESETAARARLGDEAAALATDNVALESELAEERRRTARLEQSLAEQRSEATAAIREMEQTYGALVTALREEISDKDVALLRARGGLTVSIVDRVLFPSGEATLSPEGRDVIDKVGRVFAAAPPRRVIIEGHTDNVPIGPELRARFATNWELATARATEVVHRLVERGMSPLTLEAVGRADTRPVASNATEEGRRHNRRIAIIVPDSIESR
jgi:chemotaxis protein MotB